MHNEQAEHYITVVLHPYRRAQKWITRLMFLTLLLNMIATFFVVRNADNCQTIYANIAADAALITKLKTSLEENDKRHRQHLEMVIEFDLMRIERDLRKQNGGGLVPMPRPRELNLPVVRDHQGRPRILPGADVLRAWDAGEMLVTLPNDLQPQLVRTMFPMENWLPFRIGELRVDVFDTADGGTFKVPLHLVPLMKEHVRIKQQTAAREFLSVAPREHNLLTGEVDP